MLFSTNNQWRGKPVKVDGGFMYNNRFVNLGYHWYNVDVPFEKFIEMVCIEGYAIAPAMSKDHRCEGNFISHSVALVDVDGGMTIQELLNHPHYQQYGAGYYTTPSHTEDAQRFRVIFELTTPITKPQELKDLYNGLLTVYASGDTKCKDAARLFFGTVNAKHWGLNGKVLTEEETNRLQQIGAPPAVDIDKPTYDYPPHQRNEYLLMRLKETYLGNYEEWFIVGCALKDAGYTLQDFTYVTINGMMRKKTTKDCKRLWESIERGKPTKKITMGSLHWLLHKYYHTTFAGNPTYTLNPNKL